MSTLIHFIHAGGFVMYPLLLLSLIAIIVIVERLIAYGQIGYLRLGLLSETIFGCQQGGYDEALHACRTTPGPMAACLAAILSHRNRSTREVERIVEETGQEYFIRLERFLPVLDTTTTIAPLLGLLGTIIGMIGAFNAIAAQQARGNSDAVLSGVGEALYATATGITIAVICFIAYNYFSARLRFITSETEQAATKLINVLTELRHESHAHTENTHAPSVERGEQVSLGIQAKTGA
jgi:biopolymer transport protein ExbB